MNSANAGIRSSSMDRYKDQYEKKAAGRYSRRSLLCLTVLILATGLIIFSRFIFGDETLVYEGAGSDTRQQYIMWYNSFVNHFRNDTFSFWDFTNGFGGSMFNYYVFAPFLLIIYGLGTLLGPASLAGMMVYLVLAEILLAGLLCYLMLSQWEFREEAKVITAFLYAFNGYLVVWGQHYALGFVCLELSLFILVLENALRDLFHCFTVALVCGLIIMSSYYHGYMAILGMALYVTVRVLIYEAGPLARRLRAYFAVGIAMGFGVLLGGVNLLPSAGVLSVTSRLDQSGTALQRFIRDLAPYGKEYYRTLLYRLFGSNLQGSGRWFVGDGNYYEAVNLCLGALTILMLFQFIPALVRAKKTRRQYTAVAVGAALCIFALLVKAGSLIFNGFAYAFSRHTFLVVPFLALMTCFSLSEIIKQRRISVIGMVLGLAVCAAVYGKAYLNYASRADYQRNALILLACALAAGAVLWLWSAGKLKDTLLVPLLCGAVLVSTVSDTWLSYNNRETVRKSDQVYFGTYDGSTTRALAWIAGQDDEFYRVEKDYSEASTFLDSMAQSYASATTYNSQQNSLIQRMVDQLCPRLLTGYDKNHYDFRSVIHEQPMASLMGIKYLLSHEDDLHVAGWELLHQVEDVYIYRNTGTDNIARFYTKTITQKQYKKLKEQIPRWNLVGDVMITAEKTDCGIKASDLSGREAEPVEGAVLPDQKWDYKVTDEGVYPQGTGSLTVELDEAALAPYAYTIARFDLQVDGAAQLDVYTNDGRPVEYFVQGTAHYQLPLPEGTTQITVRARNEAQVFTLRDLQIFGSRYAPEMIREDEADGTAVCRVDRLTRDDLVTGTVEVKEDGYLMLTIPYQEGWTAYLDGQETEQIVADYGFTAIRVPEGSHSFRLVYRAPLLRKGVLVSLGALGVWIILFMVMHVKRRRGKGQVPQQAAGAVQGDGD